MTLLMRIFYKIFVLDFYRVHFGFFLFMAFILFGAGDPGQLLTFHAGIIQAILTNFFTLTIMSCLWLAYFLKSMFFIKGKLDEEAQQFLFYSFSSLKKIERLTTWLATLTIINLPIALYASVCIITGLCFGNVFNAILIAFIMLSLLLVGSIAIDTYFFKRMTKRSTKGTLDFAGSLPISYTLIGIKYLLAEQKLVYAICKLFSYLMIVGMYRIFHDLQDNIALAAIIVTCLVTAHIVFLFGQFRFEYQLLNMLRNLPYANNFRFYTALKRNFLVFLPEISWLLLRFGIAESSILILYMLALSLFLYHCIFLVGLNLESFVKFTFFLFIILVVIIPFGYLTMLSLFLLCFAWLIFRLKNNHTSFSS